MTTDLNYFLLTFGSRSNTQLKIVVKLSKQICSKHYKNIKLNEIIKSFYSLNIYLLKGSLNL